MSTRHPRVPQIQNTRQGSLFMRERHLSRVACPSSNSWPESQVHWIKCLLRLASLSFVTSKILYYFGKKVSHSQSWLSQKVCRAFLENWRGAHFSTVRNCYKVKQESRLTYKMLSSNFLYDDQVSNLTGILLGVSSKEVIFGKSSC